MQIRPLRSEADYQDALRMVSAYIDHEPEAGTPEADHFEVLLTLVESYENRHYPVDLPDPIEAIKFRMEQGGMSIADMKPYLGNANRVYEVLNHKRGLSLAMIRRLHRGLQIPAEVLISG
jgi:HTH-type transcriptional regulator/antitoxin HigA